MTQDIVFLMETKDPDDFLTLLFLLQYPSVHLKGIVIEPCTPYQITLVRRALSWFDRDVPIASGGSMIVLGDKADTHVSQWHIDAYGSLEPTYDYSNILNSGVFLKNVCDENTTLIIGAPPKALGQALTYPDFKLGRLLIQGGFAGEGVVPAEKQLPKFKGRRTCASWNVGHAPQVVFDALRHPGIGRIRFVSKNVCHGVLYDQAFHKKVIERKTEFPHLVRGMEVYLAKRPEGKALHDPLAACCAIDSSIAEWAEVEVYREKGEWGSRLSPGSGVFITIGYDRARFEQTFLERDYGLRECLW
jgi:inosine-uridine nucleoside N-ribohydrolase